MSANNRPDSKLIGRRQFLVLAAAGSANLMAAETLAVEEREPPSRRPNVIVILADDLGYGDVSCYGKSAAPTPNIDSIAHNGVRFTSGYATAPMCSPSRAGLLTGRYQQRFGCEFNAGGPDRCREEGLGLSASEMTIADVMGNAGYTTGLIGKWHLGTQTQFLPTNRGFDEFFGFLYGLSLYVEPIDRPGVYTSGAIEGPRASSKSRHEFQTIYRNTEPVKESEYLTDAFTREAVQFIDRHSTDPFFLCLTYSAVHRPLQVTEQYYKRFAHIQDDQLRIYAAMVSAMDDGVGAILDKLKDKGIEKDTLLFFVSDNGAERETESNGHLNTGKYYLFEGGIRVPFVVQWPDRFPAGKTFSEPVSTLDIMPTAAAAANASLPSNRPFDGVNLLPYLTAETSTPPHDTLFWRVGPNAAARKGRWKYVELDRERVFLFDLETDVGETRNMADDEPDIVAGMAEAIKNWETKMVEPLWPSRGGMTANLSDYGLGEGTYRLFL